MTPIEQLQETVRQTLGDKVAALSAEFGELTLTVKPADYVAAAIELRDSPILRLKSLIDLCGVDYSEYGEGRWDGARFAAVSHLLSVENNLRLRVCVFADDDEFPVLPSLIEVFPAVGWYEREAFDLFGLIFDGHPDLRRILTDYGFVGHPFRKDFPVSGYVEMRYDPEQKRVIYQPVTIDPREVIPRVIREEGYGAGR